MAKIPMRRKDREVTDFDKIVKIIDQCDILRLGIADGDYPYIVPVNFAYTVEGEQICFYIHGATAGRKYELLKKISRHTEIISTILIVSVILSVILGIIIGAKLG